MNEESELTKNARLTGSCINCGLTGHPYYACSSLELVSNKVDLNKPLTDEELKIFKDTTKITSRRDEEGRTWEVCESHLAWKYLPGLFLRLKEAERDRDYYERMYDDAEYSLERCRNR